MVEEAAIIIKPYKIPSMNQGNRHGINQDLHYTDPTGINGVIISRSTSISTQFKYRFSKKLSYGLRVLKLQIIAGDFSVWAINLDIKSTIARDYVLFGPLPELGTSLTNVGSTTTFPHVNMEHELVYYRAMYSFRKPDSPSMC